MVLGASMKICEVWLWVSFNCRWKICRMSNRQLEDLQREFNKRGRKYDDVNSEWLQHKKFWREFCLNFEEIFWLAYLLNTQQNKFSFCSFLQNQNNLSMVFAEKIETFLWKSKSKWFINWSYEVYSILFKLKFMNLTI